MPIPKPFNLVATFDNLADFNEYQLDMPDYTTTHTKTVNKCQICTKNNHHKMKINFAKCANPSCYLEHEVCGKEFKILTCLNIDEVKYQKKNYFWLGIILI
jgi:hypothetical protein